MTSFLGRATFPSITAPAVYYSPHKASTRARVRAHTTAPRTMTRGVLANTIYLECLAFAITALLAASDVEGKDGSKEQPREINGVFGRATYNSNSLCYNNQ